MKKAGFSVPMALLVAVAFLAVEVHETAAVTCNPSELSPCLSAITGGTDPTEMCCAKLKEQEPCLCGYIKNPAFKPYLSSPNAEKVADKCGVQIPTSCS